MQQYITEHFDYDEVVTTDTGIENECPEGLAHNVVRLAEDVLEPSRILVGPLSVNSWYRSPEVNKAVGGEPKSAHLEGRAADVVPRGSVMSAFKMLVASDIPYDKIIYEKRNSEWIHIQVNKEGTEPRRQAYTAKPNANGKMVYEVFNA